MRIAIHQPNFMPWWPFFQKMASVDVFVLLNQCQFNREVYQHRFKFNGRWYTMSVKDVRHIDLIVNRVYASPKEDWQRIKDRLPRHRKWFDMFDLCIQPSLWQTNYEIICRIRGIMRLTNRLVVSPPNMGTGTERLVNLCRHFGGTTYLAGRSGASYMDEKLFDHAGIKLEHQQVDDTRHLFEMSL